MCNSVSPITDVLADLPATSRWQEHVYKQLHTHPELSFQETKTAALAASKLDELGYEVVERIGRTGVVGILRNGEGQTVLARAYPLTENEPEVTEKSRPHSGAISDRKPSSTSDE